MNGLPWWSKLISGLIGVFVTILCSIVAGLEWNDRRMDAKDAKLKEEIVRVKEEVTKEINTRTSIRDVKIDAMESRLNLKFENVETGMSELRADIRTLTILGRGIDRKVTTKKQELPGVYAKFKADNEANYGEKN